MTKKKQHGLNFVILNNAKIYFKLIKIIDNQI